MNHGRVPYVNRHKQEKHKKSWVETFHNAVNPEEPEAFDGPVN